MKGAGVGGGGGAREPRRLAMDAAASVLLLEPDGNLHNNRTNKRTLKALFFFPPR